MIRQQVPDHRTCHGECLTSEPTATMTWYDQLMASGRSETLTTGNSDVGMQQSINDVAIRWPCCEGGEPVY